MKYRILVTHSCDDLVEFDSEKEYTKDELYKIIEEIYYSDKKIRDGLNPCVMHNVSSGVSIEYEVEKGEE